VVEPAANGTEGALETKVMEGDGCEVVAARNELDYTFPKYNPNPEDMEMLHAWRRGA